MELQQVFQRLLAGQEEMRSTIGALQKKMDACVENIKVALRRKHKGCPKRDDLLQWTEGG
jgi:hypothetical protein